MKSATLPLPAVPGLLQGLSPHLMEWLEDFRKLRQRSPRILHIGNIANNGYNNAKLLNRAGLDCDTVCYDYYHVMGCPEWEDADYHGDTRSEFSPTWQDVELRGFVRPNWFVQGPLATCLDYLLAKREGRAEEADRIWERLNSEREVACALRRWDASRPSYAARAKRLASKFARKFWKAPYLVAQRYPPAHWAVLNTMVPGSSRFTRAVRRACRDFARLFPDRADQLRPTDLVRQAHPFHRWAKLFRHYDLVVGYSTDGVAPMLTKNVPYVAYEHGTIRKIPFEPTPQGRVCALTYRLADFCFVTNCDNNVAADELGLHNYRWVPHPINEDAHPTTEPDRVRREVREKLRAQFVIFHPARHHWNAKRDTNWDKGNDILIEGFARFVKEACSTAGAVFVEWGQTIADSKALLAKHGIEKNVLWIQPQPTPRMNAYIQAADVLADQFCIGGFGGIMPKGLLFGTPNLIYLKESVLRWCLPELPPFVNARTPDEVFAALKRLYEDPAYARQIADQGRAWYARYHSSRVVADAFAEAVRTAVSDKRKES
jgi:glycosyltransferase involved in cell wall biosynthesis